MVNPNLSTHQKSPSRLYRLARNVWKSRIRLAAEIAPMRLCDRKSFAESSRLETPDSLRSDFFAPDRLNVPDLMLTERTLSEKSRRPLALSADSAERAGDERGSHESSSAGQLAGV